MADNLTPIKELNPIGENLKGSAELPITQEGVTYKTSVNELEHRTTSKLDGRYLEKDKKIPNENLAFGRIEQGDANVISGNSVFDEVKKYLKKSEKIPNSNLTFGEVREGYENVVNGGAVYSKIIEETTKVYNERGKPNGIAPLNSSARLSKEYLNFGEVREGYMDVVNGDAVYAKIMSESNKSLKKSEKIPNSNLTFGEVKIGDNNVVSGDSVKKELIVNELMSEANNFANPVFVSAWDTRSISKDSSNDTTIQLPLTNMTNIVVDWGDGVVNSSTWHSYRTKGLKYISIKGDLKDFKFNSKGDILKLESIFAFGTITSNSSTFTGCINLELSNSIGYPKVSTSLSDFIGGSLLENRRLTKIKNVSKWCNNNVTSVNGCFYNLINFDGIGIEFWDFSNVTNGAYFMSFNKGMQPLQYEKILKSISEQVLKRDVNIDFGECKLTPQAKIYKDKIYSTYNWTIKDGGI